MTELVQIQRNALTFVSGTKSSNGNNTLVAAPTDSSRIIVKLVILQNESTTPTTMILQDGAGGNAKLRCLGQNQGDGIALDIPDGIILTANTLLNLNLSGANQCGYTIGYYLG